MLSVNWVLPATWFENNGFYGKHWFFRCFRAPSFKNIGETTNVIVNWVLPATWFENHGFYGKHWFYRCFRAPSFKNIGKTNVIRELGAPSHMV